MLLSIHALVVITNGYIMMALGHYNNYLESNGQPEFPCTSFKDIVVCVLNLRLSVRELL